ncbi:MAG: hypothetical protein IJ963_01360 [Phascolarctobacterium sp.]|nr:hypothetical protein [Phascolarctobacterium sp.]
MIEIKCLADIASALEEKCIGEELAGLLRKDLLTIKNSCDEDNEYSLETFHTDYTNNGYIAIFFGNESKDDIINLGLTGGLEETIPEAVTKYTVGNDVWTRAVIIYNDSFAMILWLKNYNGFDEWEMSEEEYYKDEPVF